MDLHPLFYVVAFNNRHSRLSLYKSLQFMVAQNYLRDDRGTWICSTASEKVMKPERKKPVKAWGGFLNGKLHVHKAFSSPAVYRTKKAAKNCYEDVRRVFITEITHDR